MRTLVPFSAFLLAAVTIPLLAAGSESLPILKQWTGQYSGVKKTHSVVVKTEKEWEAEWKLAHAKTSPLPPIPSIDFEKQMVVGYYLGTKSTGGYTAKVTKVASDASGAKVHVRLTKPKPGDFRTTVITSPYCFAVIPLVKHVTFVIE